MIPAKPAETSRRILIGILAAGASLAGCVTGKNSTKLQIHESLKQEGKSVLYGRCRLPAGAAVSCPPGELRLPFDAYVAALGDALAIPAARQSLDQVMVEQKRLKDRIWTQERRLQTLAAKLQKGSTGAPAAANARESATLERALTAARAEARVMEDQTLPAARERLATAEGRLAEIKRRLSQSGIWVMTGQTLGREVALVPFRYVDGACPSGTTWKNAGFSAVLGAGEGTGGGCCRGTVCRPAPFDPPQCQLTAAGTDDPRRVRLTVTMTGGPPSIVAVDQERRQAEAASAAFTVVVNNRSEQAESRRFVARVTGVGGAGECTTEHRIEPSCPDAYTWQARLGCCAAWMACACDAHTPDGLRWNCTLRRTGLVGDRCYSRGTREDRLTCTDRR